MSSSMLDGRSVPLVPAAPPALTAPRMASPSSRSNLTQQLEQSEGDRTPRSSRYADFVSPSKPRSLSDAPKPVLSPSPAFREPMRRVSKDDSAIVDATPPAKPLLQLRGGLSLQVSGREADHGQGSHIPRVPLSPQLDASQIYGSPSSRLPRHSRGLDYTRACTSLHHSTLAEASPDASPITGRAIQIPARRSFVNTVLDSPSNPSNGLWSLSNDRTTLSSSVSSVNMLGSDSDSDSDSSSADMAVDREMDEAILNTPAAIRLNAGLNPAVTLSPGLEWMNSQPSPSPAHASLMNYQSHLMSFRRARARKGKSHHSSSSVSMNSSKPSPAPLSPGILKSVESNANGNYFATGLSKQQVQSRRESLSLGTHELHLSDSEDSGSNTKAAAGSDVDSPGHEGPRGVIRRPVTRRGNLLPKTKGFARIRAQLLEEAAPIESEARREAEVIRQVHDNDPRVGDPVTSPVLAANTVFAADAMDDAVEDMAVDPKPTLAPDSFSRQAERNSAGTAFWNTFDDRYRTPPPALLVRENSLAVSDELIDSTEMTLPDNHEVARRSIHGSRSRSRSTTPLASHPPTAADVARRVNNKRRRDDDFDPSYTKRRAVSPGMSVQSSPILSQSPVLNSDKAWSKLPPKANGHGSSPGAGAGPGAGGGAGPTPGQGERNNSAGSVNGTKRIGMQGMNETYESMMSMTID